MPLTPLPSLEMVSRIDRHGSSFTLIGQVTLARALCLIDDLSLAALDSPSILLMCFTMV